MRQAYTERLCYVYKLAPSEVDNLPIDLFFQMKQRIDAMGG